MLDLALSAFLRKHYVASLSIFKAATGLTFFWTDCTDMGRWKRK